MIFTQRSGHIVAQLYQHVSSNPEGGWTFSGFRVVADKVFRFLCFFCSPGLDSRFIEASLFFVFFFILPCRAMTSVSWVPPRRPTLTGCFVVSWEPYTFSARLWTLLRSLPFTNSAQDTRWGSGVFFFSISDTRLSTTCVFHASMHLLQAEQPGNHFLWDLLQSLHVLTVCLWPFSCKSSFSLRSVLLLSKRKTQLCSRNVNARYLLLTGGPSSLW